MTREIITYPEQLSSQYATDVRLFDDSLFELIDDIKDTITHNNIQGLAAYQIRDCLNVVVVKDENGQFLELINPRLLSVSEKITSTEKTLYFGELSAQVPRYQNISVIYENRNAESKSLKASGDFAILLQRKIDYTFGATFIHKLSKKDKKAFDKKLDFGTDFTGNEVCPIKTYKEYVYKVTNFLLLAFALLFLGHFFTEDKISSLILFYQYWLAFGVFVGGISYIIVGYIEGKKYSTCTSCQVGNLIGTTMILYVKLIFLSIFTYFVY
jgi:peptide deformylase